jgi:hypothetical protein
MKNFLRKFWIWVNSHESDADFTLRALKEYEEHQLKENK